MEKKLTDEEVVKALELCSTKTYCEDKCEYRLSSYGFECIPKMMKQALDLIHRLQAENERLTEERNKYKELYEEMYRKWSDLQDKEFNCEALRKEKNEYFDKAVELQKQVDELTEQRDKQAYIAEELVQEKHRWTEQAVKDTAKEIILWLTDMSNQGMTRPFNMLLRMLKARYGVEVE